MFRLDFDYLNELPILVLDVDDDFKNDRIKQQEIIDKVGAVSSSLVFHTVCCRRLIVSLSLCRSKSFSQRFNFIPQSQQATEPRDRMCISSSGLFICLWKFLSFENILLLREIFMETIMFCNIANSILWKTCLYRYLLEMIYLCSGLSTSLSWQYVMNVPPQLISLK